MPEKAYRPPVPENRHRASPKRTRMVLSKRWSLETHKASPHRLVGPNSCLNSWIHMWEEMMGRRPLPSPRSKVGIALGRGKKAATLWTHTGRKEFPHTFRCAGIGKAPHRGRRWPWGTAQPQRKGPRMAAWLGTRGRRVRCRLAKGDNHKFGYTAPCR